MTQVKVVSSSMLDPEERAVALIGAARDGNLVGWLGVLSALPAHDSLLERRQDDLLPFQPGHTPDEALTLLEAWPAWRVTEAASLELGSRALVVGARALGARVAKFARLRGALTVQSEIPRTADAAPMDVVILVAGPAGLLTDAAEVCRPRGTIVLAGTYTETLDFDLYHHVHRRGLRVVSLAPYSTTLSARFEWARSAPALQRVLHRHSGVKR